MTQIASPAPPPQPPAAPAEAVVRRVTLRGVPWLLYERLLAVVGDGLPRMTYDRGLLELEMPSKLHETLKWIAGRAVEAYAEELGIEYEAVGSMTLRKESEEGGLEADESYYVRHCGLVRGREVDLAVDPPPDLAIEIDLSPPDVEKVSVYARLGVPEIWRWRLGRLVALLRRSDGSYVEQPRSSALPDFPLEELARALASYPDVPQAQIVRDFRRLCKDLAARTARGTP